MEDRIEEVDRISALPEPILLHIMSFLPLKQVAQTTVLSKAWKQIKHIFPVLEFNKNLWGKLQSIEKLLTLVNYVENTLQTCYRERLPIKKLKLCLATIHGVELSSFLECCLDYAIKCNVKELELEVPHQKEMYNLPEIVLCSKLIETLALYCCELKSPRSVKLSSLRKLYLQHVSADDTVIKDIAAGCPLLEDISFYYCRGFKRLELLDLDKLNKILLGNNRELERVEIKSLNVHSVTTFTSFFEFMQPCEIYLVNCKNLKFLHLCCASITDKQLYNNISNVPLLEDLCITECHELESIRISSPRLRSLLISSCKNLVAVKLEMPNLSTFNYKGDIISFSSDDLAVSVAELFFVSKTINTQWYFQYIELLVKFHQLSKVLKLKSKSGENVLFPEELRQIVVPPFCGVKDMNFSICGAIRCAAVKNAVDGLLWSTPHAKTLSIKSADNHFRSKFCFEFEFSYKKKLIYEGDIPQCCKRVPVSCWEQCIEEVKVEVKLENKPHNEVKCYIFKGEKIWEEMDCLTYLPIID